MAEVYQNRPTVKHDRLSDSKQQKIKKFSEQERVQSGHSISPPKKKTTITALDYQKVIMKFNETQFHDRDYILDTYLMRTHLLTLKKKIIASFSYDP